MNGPVIRIILARIGGVNYYQPNLHLNILKMTKTACVISPKLPGKMIMNWIVCPKLSLGQDDRHLVSDMVGCNRKMPRDSESASPLNLCLPAKKISSGVFFYIFFFWRGGGR